MSEGGSEGSDLASSAVPCSGTVSSRGSIVNFLIFTVIVTRNNSPHKHCDLFHGYSIVTHAL